MPDRWKKSPFCGMMTTITERQKEGNDHGTSDNEGCL